MHKKHACTLQRLLLFLVFLFSFSLHLYVMFDKRLITSLGSEVQFPGRLGPRCFSAVLHAINATSLLSAQVPSYLHFGANLSQLSIPPECGQRLQPLFADLSSKSRSTVMRCLLQRRLVISARDHSLLVRSLKNLRDAFQKANLELVLEAGSLLGSLRHHGRIVYDDDIDFRIRNDQKEQVRKVLLAIPNSRFRDTEAENGHWKLDLINLEYKFQIDFFFWWKSQQSLQFTDYPFNFLIETVYPLSKRPFEDVLFDSPRDPLRMMQTYFDQTSLMECRSFDHSPFRRDNCPGRMDCAMLEPFVPFVRKITDDRFGSVELLLQSIRLLRVFFLPKNH